MQTQNHTTYTNTHAPSDHLIVGCPPHPVAEIHTNVICARRGKHGHEMKHILSKLYINQIHNGNVRDARLGPSAWSTVCWSLATSAVVGRHLASISAAAWRTASAA